MDDVTAFQSPHPTSLGFRPLGTTGMSVSPIGLGTVKLGRNQGVKYARPFDLPTDEQAHALLARAADLGVNLIDTAPAYGASEERLGKLLSDANWFGSRSRWVISTKAGEEYEQGVSRFDFSASAIRSSVLRSLQRLRTDYLDLVLIHSSGEDSAIISSGDAISALLTLKHEGKVRAIGMSTKTVEGGMLALGVNTEQPSGAPSLTHHQRWCDVLMVTLNQSDTSQLPVIREAGRRGVGILIKKAFESGHVSADLHRTPTPSSLAQPALDTTIIEADPIRRSLAFVFTQGGAAISSIVSGTINPDHLAANVQAAAAINGTKA